MGSIHLQPHAGNGAPTPELREIQAGVYAYVQLDGGWGLNNAGFLVGRQAVTIVDTCFTEARSRAYQAALRRTTSLPVSNLINTHHHGDHTYGNFLFKDATIIGHRLTRETILETGFSTQSLFPGVDWGNIEITPPTLTFEDRLSVYVDDLRLDLIFLGPAHTTNDVIVWIPDRRLAFTGDLIFNQCTPFVAMGSLSGAMKALEFLRGLGAETIVPGHGEICGPAAIETSLEYLRWVDGIARNAHQAGLTPLDAARQTDLGHYQDWPDSERIVANIRRAFSELNGEPLGHPLPLGVAVAEMIEFNGGQPLRCLA